MEIVGMSNKNDKVDIRLASKENTVKIRGLCKKRNCYSQTMAVQKKTGGFVQWQCQKCGKFCYVEDYDFRNSTEFAFICFTCNQQFSRERDYYSNYIYNLKSR